MCFPEPTLDPALHALEEIVRRHVPEPDRADALLLLEVVRRRGAAARSVVPDTVRRARGDAG